VTISKDQSVLDVARGRSTERCDKNGHFGWRVGSGRLLGNLLYELVLLVMKNECGPVDSIGSIDLLETECIALVGKIESVEEKTDSFLATYKVPTIEVGDDVHCDKVDELNNILFEPIALSDFRAAIELESKLETFLRHCQKSLMSIPKIPDSIALHHRAQSLLNLVKSKHSELVYLHANFDRVLSKKSVENKKEMDWRIENESISLIQ
jgi:hypothetical protein